MTDKIVAQDASGKAIKTPGWFSWRHKTREAHDAARERYLTRASRRPRQWWDEDAGQWRKGEVSS